MSDDDDDDDDGDVERVVVDDASKLAELTPLIARLAKDWLGFERLRQALRNQQAPDPLTVSPTERDVEKVVMTLLGPDRNPDDVERTYVALKRGLADHPEFAKLILGETLPVHDDGEAEAAFQAMLNARDDVFARWHEFQGGMNRVGLTICQIHVRRRFKGTGFLVSDRHVLTAFHCVSRLTSQGKALPNSHADLSVVFDDVVLPGKSTSVFRAEIGVAHDWLVCQSPPDDAEGGSPTPLDAISEGRLDFALIRLAERAGAMAPGFQATPRKWLTLSDLAPAPDPQAQVLVAHHPGGTDLRLSVGLFRDHALSDRRVRYLAPTIIGSSGAPCFTIEWKPYALHNAGYRVGPVNQGVPLCLIWKAISDADVLRGDDDRTSLLPASTPEGEPILGRGALVDEVDAIVRGERPTTVIMLSGDLDSGKSYTGKLLRSLLIDRGEHAFAMSAEKFAADTPEAFARRLVNEIIGVAPNGMPPSSPDSRQRARWIARQLSDWIRSSMTAPAAAAPGAHASARRSIWVILDDCDTVQFGPEMQDLLAAVFDHEPSIDESPLRFILLGRTEPLASVAPEKVFSAALSLMSVEGVLPFMKDVMATLSVEDDELVLRRSAADFVDSAINFGVDTIPKLVIGLKKWRDRRLAAVAEPSGV